MLNLSDGEHSLLDIAERSGLPFATINDAAELLAQGGLLSAVSLSESKTVRYQSRGLGES